MDLRSWQFARCLGVETRCDPETRMERDAAAREMLRVT